MLIIIVYNHNDIVNVVLCEERNVIGVAIARSKSSPPITDSHFEPVNNTYTKICTNE